jgi:acetyltransferase
VTVRNLDKLFAPRSAVLIGASDRPGSVGSKMTENFLGSGFKGPVWLVNPRHGRVHDLPCYADVESVPGIPDLAVIAIPPQTVPETVGSLGRKGTRAAVVVSAGLREQGLEQALLDAARPDCLRIVGPNCLGVMVPGVGINAGFAHAMPQDGDLAFISQSGALVSAVLDWSLSRNVGFSCMVSMGDMADVDVGDLLDYLAADTGTRAILMYLEQVTSAHKFMSAARSAARVKPVVVVKSGRHRDAAKAALSHTGAMAGSDIVYDAAFRRAGVVRVRDLEDLFDAAEILSRARPLRGDRLAVITNGGGAGILAVDGLEDRRGRLATLSEATIATLNAALPPIWSKGNPVDVIGDAGPERYAAALEAVLADPGTDAVLVINCPTALASGAAAAEATVEAFRKSGKDKPILTCWLGDAMAAEPRRLFAEAGIPTFENPDDAVLGFTCLTSHMKAQEALMRAPPGLPAGFSADAKKARAIIRSAMDGGRSLLSEPEAKAVLAAYGIATVPTVSAVSSEEARDAAEEMLRAGADEVVVKILSDDITHKMDAGGVVLGLASAQAVEIAARDMMARIKRQMPDARIKGFTVQPMIRRPHARELIVGVAEDKTFGPVILFGSGGTAVEAIGDKAVGLPPLDLKLARDLMERTRIYRLLQGYRNVPGADLDAVALTLVRISQLIVDVSEIAELDINPLLADDQGVLALDARIIVQPSKAGRDTRFAIRPYPNQWEKGVALRNGRAIFLRPIRPEDEKLYAAFMSRTSAEDLYHRFFSVIKDCPRDFIASLTQIDYARAMAFVALDVERGELLGVSRLAADPDYTRAEYAVLVRSDRQNEGIGWALMQQLVDYARAEAIGELWGEVMCDNAAMLKMCKDLGFTVERAGAGSCISTLTICAAPA